MSQSGSSCSSVNVWKLNTKLYSPHLIELKIACHHLIGCWLADEWAVSIIQLHAQSVSWQTSSSHFCKLLGLTLLTLLPASWSESAFSLSVCRGSGGSHWSRYGMYNQLSSSGQQFACLLVITRALVCIWFYITLHPSPSPPWFI